MKYINTRHTRDSLSLPLSWEMENTEASEETGSSSLTRKRRASR